MTVIQNVENGQIVYEMECDKVTEKCPNLTWKSSDFGAARRIVKKGKGGGGREGGTNRRAERETETERPTLTKHMYRDCTYTK